ncbi:hypothetical protein [uncultured Sphingomonas sp.]|uniref:hypothetical protein n=1 Tax=uncultured Sphingomonas sp. TaxID=158754 RepID=UPI003748C531
MRSGVIKSTCSRAGTTRHSETIPMRMFETAASTALALAAQALVVGVVFTTL